MRFRSLGELARRKRLEVELSSLPDKIVMARYARDKAFKISELAREVHGKSFEWYGFTIASRDEPGVVVDVGLPRNTQNVETYTSIDPEEIAEFLEGLPGEYIINGWIHSHGEIPLEEFSSVDHENNLTVLDYVTPLLKIPLRKSEVVVNDLSLLAGEGHTEDELKGGSVTLITDREIKDAKILETVYGGFCYSIVIGDGGWHRQEILYKERGVLSGESSVDKKKAELELVDTGRSLEPDEINNLRVEVRENITPIKYKLLKPEAL